MIRQFPEIFKGLKKSLSKTSLQGETEKISTYVKKQDSLEAFQIVGLDKGDNVMMHSSMSAFGTIVGGP